MQARFKARFIEQFAFEAVLLPRDAVSEEAAPEVQDNSINQCTALGPQLSSTSAGSQRVPVRNGQPFGVRHEPAIVPEQGQAQKVFLVRNKRRHNKRPGIQVAGVRWASLLGNHVCCALSKGQELI